MQAKNLNKILIECPSRIHLTLLAMDDPIYRINGGIGFSIDGNNLKVVATKSDHFSIKDVRENKFSENHCQRFIQALEKVKSYYNLNTFASFNIESGPPSHSGFGVGTAAILSIIEAYLILNNKNLSEEEIVLLSGRGGTSGIGIHTYFHGGFIFDTGLTGQNNKHLPSRSERTTNSRPRIACSLDMPSWEMGIFLPQTGLHISGEHELDFFSRICPISHEEACKAVYHAILGTLCSVAEKDFNNFCKSLNNLQNTKWKREEINRQGVSQKKLIEDIQSMTLGAAMSSLGPAILFLCENFETTKLNLVKKGLLGKIYKVSANNQGRIITYA